jgi:hypothetical protein
MTLPAIELRSYRVYGLRLRTSLMLTFPAEPPEAAGDPDVEIREDSAGLLAGALEHSGLAPDREAWTQHARLADGSTYVRWEDLFHFLIPADGRHIVYGPLGDASEESIQTYLLGQVLSYALTKQGHEPLHATVVVIGGRAVGFLGESGMGKATLAAAFLKTGATLLTDDLLRLAPHGAGYLAFPGPPRIKLLPHAAKELVSWRWNGSPMNPLGEKLVIPLPASRIALEPVPLAALYALSEPLADGSGEADPDAIIIRHLSQREAMIEILAHTYNKRVLDHARLIRQFQAAQVVASAVPVRVLSYPRRLERILEVRDAVCRDLETE